jgi:hypothetical protein
VLPLLLDVLPPLEDVLPPLVDPDDDVLVPLVGDLSWTVPPSSEPLHAATTASMPAAATKNIPPRITRPPSCRK